MGYGMKMNQRQLVAHQREQTYIAKMRELRSQGFTYEQIAQALNSLGIPTKTHKGKWHRKTVNAILKTSTESSLTGIISTKPQA